MSKAPIGTSNAPAGRAIDLNRPTAVQTHDSSARPVRKVLCHTSHFHGRFGATFFVTICCQLRGVNQLCRDQVASCIFETARRYHHAQRWYLKLLLLMPDHLHILVAIAGDAELSKLIRDFKRISARVVKIKWQRNFFDHRLRHDESEGEKAAYIRANPIRGGLIREGEGWPFVICEIDLEPPRAVR